MYLCLSHSHLALISRSLQAPTSTKTPHSSSILCKISINSVLTYSPRDFASTAHSELQPSSSNLTNCDSSCSYCITWLQLTPSPSLRVTILNSLARVAAITAIGNAAFWDDPSALNSNLWPVQAQGLVLFLSVSSWQTSCGRQKIQLFKFFFRGGCFPSIIDPTVCPKYAEMILGGASCPPNLISLPGGAIAPKYSALLRLRAMRVIKTNNLKSWLSSVPGTENKLQISPFGFTQLIDQFACFPLPLSPRKGFQCRRTVQPCLSKVSLRICMVTKLWKMDLPASSQMAQNQNWLFATSLCLVLKGMPISSSSPYTSFRISSTFPGILPQQWSENCWFFAATLPKRHLPAMRRSCLCRQAVLGTTKNSCSSPSARKTSLCGIPSACKRAEAVSFMTASDLRQIAISSRASPLWATSIAGMYITLFFLRIKTSLALSQTLQALARWVCLRPPEGKLLPSASPFSSNSVGRWTRGSPCSPFSKVYFRSMSDSCFSQAAELWGKERKEQWSTSCSPAQSTILWQNFSAEGSGSLGSGLKTCFPNLRRTELSLQSKESKVSELWLFLRGVSAGEVICSFRNDYIKLELYSIQLAPRSFAGNRPKSPLSRTLKIYQAAQPHLINCFPQYIMGKGENGVKFRSWIADESY